MDRAYALRLEALPSQVKPHVSSRIVRRLLVIYTLLVVADVASTLVILAGKPAPVWRWEWNPLMAAVMRLGGMNGWLGFEGVCLLVPWVVSLATWRIQFDWSMENAPRAKAFVRRLVLVPVVTLCLWRGGAAGFNLAQIALASHPGPTSPAPVVPIATTTASATSAPTATVSATATSVPIVATSTSIPQATVTPTPRPTATPRPQPTPTATHCPHNNCGG